VLLLLAGSLAALAVPVLLAPIPPLLDYPNHLVRLWLITGGTGSPPLSQMYAVSWGSAHTNVGIDYLGALLGTFIPAIPLGSLFIALALVLPPLGAVALNRAVLGGLHWWQIAFVYFAWNATLIAGFLNFHIGLGLALLAAALEPRLSRSGAASRAAARLAIAALLLVVHVFALAFYCALVAGVAFGRHLPTWRQIGPYVWRAALAAAPAATPALIFPALAPALSKAQGRVRVMIDGPHRPGSGGLSGAPICSHEVGGSQLIVNIFDGGPRTSVSYDIPGDGPRPMQRVAMKDPFVCEFYARQPGMQKGWVRPVVSSHVWRAPLPAHLSAGAHRLRVVARDEYGTEIVTHKVLEVAPAAASVTPA